MQLGQLPPQRQSARLLLCALVWRLAVTVADPPASEVAALRALYSATGGLAGGWTRSLGWAGSADACSWQGVACDLAGANVIGVDVASNNLVGTVPDSALSALPHLQTLRMSANFATVTLPVACRNLKVLDLSFVVIAATLPASAVLWGQLQQLLLRGTHLIGTVPSWLLALPALQVLDVSDNAFSGTLPAFPARMPNLTALIFDSAGLSGGVPDGWTAPALITLSLSNNNFTGPVLSPGLCSRAPSLGRLAAAGNGLEGSWSFLLEQCPQLSSLVLANNRLDGPYPVSLARQSLVELTLTGNPLQQACPLSRTMTCLMDRMPPYVLKLDPCGDVPTSVGVDNVTTSSAVVTWRSVPSVASGAIGGALVGYMVNLTRYANATGCSNAWVCGCLSPANASSCTLSSLARGEAYFARVIPLYDWGPGSGCAGNPPTCPVVSFQTSVGLPEAAPTLAIASVTSTAVTIVIDPVPLFETGQFPVLSYLVAVTVAGTPQPTLSLAAAAPAGMHAARYTARGLPPRALVLFSVAATTVVGTGPAGALQLYTCAETEHGDVLVGGVPTCVPCPIDRTCNGSAQCALPGYVGTICTVCDAGFYRPECTSPCSPCPANAWLATGVSAMLVLALAVFVLRKQPFSLTLGVVRIGIDSAQLIALAVAPIRSWPPFVLAARGVFAGGSFISLSAVHSACIGAIAGPLGQWSELTVSGVAVPLCLTAIFVSTETAVGHGWLASGGTPALFLRRMSLTLLLYVFVAAMQAYVDLFACITGVNGMNVLLRDDTIECSSPAYAVALTVAVVCIVAWVAAIAASGAALWRARDSAVLELPAVFRSYGSLYWMFRRRVASFVAVVFARRLLCVVVVGAAPLMPAVGLSLAAILNIAYCALVVRWRPYVPMVRQIPCCGSHMPSCFRCGSRCRSSTLPSSKGGRGGVWVDSLNVVDVACSGATALVFVGSVVDSLDGGAGSGAAAAAGATTAACVYAAVGTALGLVLCATRGVGRDSGNLRATGPALLAELDRLEGMMGHAASADVNDLLLAEELQMQVAVLRRRVDAGLAAPQPSPGVSSPRGGSLRLKVFFTDESGERQPGPVGAAPLGSTTPFGRSSSERGLESDRVGRDRHGGRDDHGAVEELRPSEAPRPQFPASTARQPLGAIVDSAASLSTNTAAASRSHGAGGGAQASGGRAPILNRRSSERLTVDDLLETPSFDVARTPRGFGNDPVSPSPSGTRATSEYGSATTRNPNVTIVRRVPAERLVIPGGFVSGGVEVLPDTPAPVGRTPSTVGRAVSTARSSVADASGVPSSSAPRGGDVSPPGRTVRATTLGDSPRGSEPRGGRIAAAAAIGGGAGGQSVDAKPTKIGRVSGTQLSTSRAGAGEVQRTVPMLGGSGAGGGALARINSVAVMRVDVGKGAASARPEPLEIPSELTPGRAPAAARSSTLAASAAAVVPSKSPGPGQATPSHGGVIGGGGGPAVAAVRRLASVAASADTAASAPVALQTPADALARMRGVRRDVESTLEAVYDGWEQAAAADIAAAHRGRDLATLHARFPGRGRPGHGAAAAAGQPSSPAGEAAQGLSSPKFASSASPRVSPPSEPDAVLARPHITEAAIAAERARAEAVLSKSLIALRQECVAREWYGAAYEVDARARIAQEIVAVALASAATRSLSNAHARLAAALHWMVGRRVATAARSVDAAARTAQALMAVLAKDPRHSTRARIATAIADVAHATAPSVLARHFVDALRRAAAIASSAGSRGDFAVAAAAAHGIAATHAVSDLAEPTPRWRTRLSRCDAATCRRRCRAAAAAAAAAAASAAGPGGAPHAVARRGDRVAPATVFQSPEQSPTFLLQQHSTAAVAAGQQQQQQPFAELCTAIAAPTLAFCSSGVYHPASKMAAAAALAANSVTSAAAGGTPIMTGSGAARLSILGRRLMQRLEGFCVRVRGTRRFQVLIGVLFIAVVAVSTAAAAGAWLPPGAPHTNSSAPSGPPPLSPCARHVASGACAMEYVAVPQRNASFTVAGYDGAVSLAAEFAAVFAGLMGMPAACNPRVSAMWCRAALPACDARCAPVRPCLSECRGIWASCAPGVDVSRLAAAVGAAAASIPAELTSALAAAYGPGDAQRMMALARSAAACDAALYAPDGACWRSGAPPPPTALQLESNACV